MKQLVVAIGFAIASSAVSANSIKGCKPEIPCAPMEIKSSQLDSDVMSGQTDASLSDGKGIQRGTITTVLANDYSAEHRPSVKIDFAGQIDQSTPLYVKGNGFGVGLGGSAKVVNSYQGFPATHWFGDQADFTFILVSSRLQIMLAEPVSAASMDVAIDEDYKMLLPADAKNFGHALDVILLDVNGDMIDDSSILLTESPKTLNVSSGVPFRSIILSNAFETWMLSNLKFTTWKGALDDATKDQPAPNNEYLVPVNDPVETRSFLMDESSIPVNDPVEERSATG